MFHSLSEAQKLFHGKNLDIQAIFSVNKDYFKLSSFHLLGGLGMMFELIFVKLGVSKIPNVLLERPHKGEKHRIVV